MNQQQDYSPCLLSENGSHYTIEIATESHEVYMKYNPVFERHGYSGNGYSWEGHLTQIMEKEDPELVSHIDFDPEAGSFFALADTKENQIRFAKLIHRYCFEVGTFEKYIESADRDRVDD